MNAEDVNMAYSGDDDRPLVEVGGARVTTPSELVQAAPALKQPDQLLLYCRAVNHLKHGTEYRLIPDPDAYRSKYRRRLASEDPKAPWQDGVPRVSDFGVCETAEIALPRMEGESVIFYVEDDYLGIPYRVTAPAPNHPEGEISYEPLPMTPLQE